MDPVLYGQVLRASRINDVVGIKKGFQELDLYIDPTVEIKNNPSKLLDYDYDFLINTQKLMNELLMDALSHGDLELVSYLVDFKELKIKSSIKSADVWISAINSENLDIVKYIATHPNSESKGVVFALLSRSLSCKNTDILHYLIDDSSMPHQKAVLGALRLGGGENERFSIYVNSCVQGNKPWVEFLLKNDQTKEMINSTTFHKGLTALAFGSSDNAELVEFLLTDECIPYKPYTDFDPNRVLVNAGVSNSHKILNYLIFDFKIPEPSDYESLFFSGKDTSDELPESTIETISRLKRLFEMRRLNNELQSGLDIKSDENKPKRKI